MSEPEIVDIDTKYPTVRALLAATATPENLLGDGSTAFGYRFPSRLGLDEAVLRVSKKPALDKLLARTTALTPVESLLTGINMGQPLLHSNTNRIDKPFTIVLHQPGKSLYDISLTLHGDDRHTQKSVSRKQLLDSIVSLHRTSGKNPFIPLLLRSIQLMRAGYKPDLNWTNVFVNERTGSLELIDQLDPNRKCDPDDTLFRSDVSRLYGQIVTSMLRSEPTSIEDPFEHAALRSYLDRMEPVDRCEFDAAYREVIALLRDAQHDITKRHIDDKEPVPPLQFAPSRPFNAVNSTQAIALTDPPSKLVAELKRLHAIVNAPAR